jgi:2-polyprenyl-6-methoxyphenol hydroxylase-like FAD-dependent oxidoreductase
MSGILVVGGGIGRLTAAIALRRNGLSVEVIERDPDWSVDGVGIIQQSEAATAEAAVAADRTRPVRPLRLYRARKRGHLPWADRRVAARRARQGHPRHVRGHRRADLRRKQA